MLAGNDIEDEDRWAQDDSLIVDLGALGGRGGGGGGGYVGCGLGGAFLNSYGDDGDPSPLDNTTAPWVMPEKVESPTEPSGALRFEPSSIVTASLGGRLATTYGFSHATEANGANVTLFLDDPPPPPLPNERVATDAGDAG